MANKIFYLRPAYARLVVQAFTKKGIHALDELGAQCMAEVGTYVYAVEKSSVLYLAKVTPLTGGGGIDCQVGSFRHSFTPASFKHNTDGATYLSTNNAKQVADAFHKRGISQVSFLDTKHMQLIKSTVSADIYVTEKLGIVYVAQISRRSTGSIECQVTSFPHHFHPAPFQYSR